MINLIIYLIIVFAAESWPQVLDDSDARQDWLWKPKYNMENLVANMMNEIRNYYIQNGTLDIKNFSTI